MFKVILYKKSGGLGSSSTALPSLASAKEWAGDWLSDKHTHAIIFEFDGFTGEYLAREPYTLTAADRATRETTRTRWEAHLSRMDSDPIYRAINNARACAYRASIGYRPEGRA